MVSSKSVRHAVIPAAGWGTRFLPATKVVPKVVLPILDQPVIGFSVQEAAASGLSEVVMVASRNQAAVREYFGRAAELERFLEGKGDQARLTLVRAPGSGVSIATVLQEEQLGLGHAVLLARETVGDEPFAVLLPDEVFDAKVPAITQLLDVYRETGCSVIAVMPAAREEISRYGIIDPERMGPGRYRVKGIVEKPHAEEAPSNLRVVGRYVFTPGIFEELRRTKPGALGEIQLTDGIAALLKREPVYAIEVQGELLDAGTPLGLLKASIYTALRRPDLGPDLREWLRQALGS